MWREFQRMVVPCALALTVAACTNGSAETTSTPAATVTTQTPTTTAANPATTTTASSVTTTTAFVEQVGSPEALAAALREATANSALAFPDADLTQIAPPDLTVADPAAAATALALVEFEVAATAPAVSWLDVVTAPNSPARSNLARGLQELANRRLRVVLDTGTYRVDEAVTVTAQDLAGRTDSAPENVPQGAAYVLITTSSPSYKLIDLEGEIVDERPGWTRRTRGVIVVPSEIGWQLYWEESA